MKGIETIWKEAYNNNKFPVLLINNYSTIIKINKNFRDMFGYSQNDLLNKSLLDFTAREDQPKEVNNFMDIFFGNKKESLIAKRFIKKNKDSVLVHQYTLPIYEEPDEAQFALIYLLPHNKESLFNVEKIHPGEISIKS